MRWRVGLGWAAVAGFLAVFSRVALEDGWDPKIPWILGFAASVWILAGMIVGLSLAKWIGPVRRILVLGCWMPLALILFSWSVWADGESPISARVWIDLAGVLMVALGTDGLVGTGAAMRGTGWVKRCASWTAGVTLAVLAVTTSKAIAMKMEAREAPTPPPTRWARTMAICIELRERYPHWDRTDFTFPEWMARHKEDFRRVAESCPGEGPCPELLDVVQAALGEFENGHVRVDKPPAEDPSGDPEETSTNPSDPAVPAAPLRVTVRPGKAPVIRIVELNGDEFVRLLHEGVDHPSAARAVVLDLRGCRGGDPRKMEHLISHFLASDAATGRFAGANEAGTRETVRDIELFRVKPEYAGSLAVLMDPRTASGAEVAADLLCRRPRTRCFGYWTAGSTDLANAFALEDGKVWVSAATYETPDGEILEGRGVRPHELFYPFGQRFPAAGDKILAAADAWLASESSSPEVHSAP